MIKIKSLFFVIAISVMSFAHAATTTTPTWKQLICKTWMFDSTLVSTSSYPTKADAYNKLFFRLTNEGVVYTIKSKEIKSDTYYVADIGKTHMLIMLSIPFKVISVDAKSLKLQTLKNEYGATTTLFLSANDSVKADNYGSTWADQFAFHWQKLAAIPHLNMDEVTASDSVLPKQKILYDFNFNKNGQVKFTINEKTDSGTWSFDSSTLKLRIHGAQISKDFVVIQLSEYAFTIKGMDKADTLVSISKFYEDEASTYDEEYYDETEVDSTAIDTDYEYDEYNYDEYASAYDKIRKEWSASYAYSDYDEESSDLKEKIQIKFYNEEDVELTVGKKKYKGTWVINEDKYLVMLTLKGKQQVCYYSMESSNSLELTLVLPGEKSAKTYVFDKTGDVDEELMDEEKTK